jgi:hypothetical protein
MNSEQLPLRFRLLELLGEIHGATSLESSPSNKSCSSERVGPSYKPVISKPALLSTETYQHFQIRRENMFWKTENVIISLTFTVLIFNCNIE